ncbi:MAG TPA: 6-bladed beta-propeller [Geobacteraceae bacterium]
MAHSPNLPRLQEITERTKPIAVRAALGFLVLCLTACATPASLYETRPSVPIQWPQPPLPAKIVWVRSIASPQDAGIGKGFWKRALELVIGTDERRIIRPHGVLFDEKEQLFIADPGAGLVHWMDLKKGRYTVIGTEGGHPFRTPIGLAEDEGGRLYITDSTAGKVFIYDLAGGTLTPLILLHLERPTGIAYNRVNKLLYIVDTTAGQVVGIDGQGVERVRFGSAGEGKTQFNHPTDIAVNARGELYVTDPLNYRIKLFSPEGHLVSEIGEAGDSQGNLNKPKGVAVDSEGHVFVCDAMLDSVQIFDEAGRFLLSFGDTGVANGQFWMPSGIFIDRNNYIFVADTYNQRLQVFRYLAGAGPDEGKSAEPMR